MKNILKTLVLIIAITTLSSCSNDDDNGSAEVSKTYALASVTNPAISGTAKFIKNADKSVTIELQLTGTPSGGMHPAHIHFNTAAEGGDIALTLGTVDGGTGFSSKTTSTLDGGTTVTYEDLLNFDGYINVHLSTDNLGTLVAQGDIGQNELTGMTKSYPLASVYVPAISGSIKFSERVNGEALAKIELANTSAGGMHPAHIHMGSVATAPGAILFTFKPVVGSTGISLTNVSQLNNGTNFGYSDVLTVNGYVNVHLSATELGTLIGQGNIGSNN